MDKLYRVVDCEGRPVKTGQPRRERTYLRKSTAQAIATSLNDECYDTEQGQVLWHAMAPYRVQMTVTNWQEI